MRKSKNLLESIRKLITVGLTGLVMGSMWTPAMAQSDASSVTNFPNRVIKIIVPFGAGGPADALARPLSEALSKKLNVPVIVENRPGANAAIASQLVAKAPADGYTLLFASDAGMSLAPATQKALPYDPARDFDGVSLVAQFSQLLFAGPNFPAKTIQELQAIAAKAPNSVSYASIGVGSQSHIGLEALSKILNIKMIHVPYTGAPLGITDVIAGNVQIMMSTVSGPLPFIKAGKIRPIAVAGVERNKSLPQVPTFAEAGIPNFESRGWFGVVAPAKTPPAIVQLLSQSIWEITQSEEYIAKAVEFNGFEIARVNPRDFSGFLERDRQKWKALVEQMGDAIKN